MLYYDFYTYKNWQFLLIASAKGLRSIDLYVDQDLKDYKHDTSFMMPYINTLSNYFKGETIPKDLPLDLIGTAFEKQVWHELYKIPFGQTKSYKDIAMLIQNPKAYQAVGNAVGKNPILCLIPCHRIIKSDGSIGGFSSDIHLKVDLLHFERSTKS